MTYDDYKNLKAGITADVADLLTEAENDRDVAIDLCYQYADSSEHVVYYYKAKNFCLAVEGYEPARFDEAEAEMFELLVTDKHTTMDRLYTLIAYHIILNLAIEALDATETA